ncbi:65a13214-4d27-4355-bfba-71426e453fca [Sclerotinia trifoliorum]|uniref:65a13214-4d27-4355-bfba-71426e453fca n=1 Tax=Sclerotinia trifoliorum TaxID=28548 RepID=A0A8H2W3I8_9HELO|nr:65a13214-4d27-4355-bfba-71426e453fca [Sclerotinia trifoliorum]
MVFPNSNPVILLAEPQDTPRLADITTRAFKASDAIYPVILGSTALGYTQWLWPVDLKTVLFKADTEVDGKREKQKADIEKFDGSATVQTKQKIDEGWKTPAGINFDLFMRKVKGPIECKQRDYDAERDIILDLCFVDPKYQKLGIGNMLLQWGLDIVHKQGRKICLVSTPQARKFYEKGE